MRRPYRYALIGFIIVVAVVGGAISLGLMWLDRPGTWEPTAASRCPDDKDIRTYSQWRQSVTFPYTAPESKLRQVKDNWNQIDLGSSREQVLKAFGPPDFQQDLYPKQIHPPCVGYMFEYYFDSNGTVDSQMEVWFSRDGKAYWIIDSVGLVEKGNTKGNTSVQK